MQRLVKFQLRCKFIDLYFDIISISNSILYLDTCLQLYLDVATTIRPDIPTVGGGMFMFKMVSQFEYICIF